MRHPYRKYLRYLLYVLALLPAFIFRDYTPNNELKYISIVEEALNNGTWFTFYNHGEIYADKPPLYFWLMMLSRLITGGWHMWILGLFSLLPAAGVMVVMDRWMRIEKVGHSATISNLMLGTTAMFIGGALVLRMDMLMTFFIVLSLYTFFKLYKGVGRPWERWMLPVWVFLAIFSKGPMGFAIPFVAVVVFLLLKRHLRYAGRWFGWRQWLILLGLCGVWFGLIYCEGGSEYLTNILFKQTVGRAVDSFHHDEHLFWYFPRMLYSFAPWILVYLFTFWLGVRRHLIRTDTERFFYTTVWANIIMLSLVSSKIEIYMLPLYPFVAYFASAMLTKLTGSSLVRFGVWVPAVIFALLWPASFVLEGLLPFQYESLFVVRLGLLAGTVGGLVAIYALIRKQTRSAIRAISAGMLATVFIVSFSLPQFNDEIGFEYMAREAEAVADKNGIEHYAFYHYRAFADMDIFLGQQLEKITSLPQLDSLDAADRQSVLFFRNRDVRKNETLKAWVEARPKAGAINKDYYWLVVGRTAEEVPQAATVPTE